MFGAVFVQTPNFYVLLSCGPNKKRAAPASPSHLREHRGHVDALATDLKNFVRSVSTPQHDSAGPEDWKDEAPLLPLASSNELNFSGIRKEELHRSKKSAILHINRLAEALKQYTGKKPQHTSSGQIALKLLNFNHGRGLRSRTVFKALFVKALEELLLQVHEIEDTRMGSVGV